jgi:DNA sulfur modification protein DndD
MLSNKGEFYVQVHINKDTLGVSIETAHGAKKEVSQLSAGERQIFATALIWALAEISDRPLPFIIDTPLGRLDQEHRENLVESFFPNASHQVLVLSTDTEITDEYYDFLTTKTAAEYHLRHDDTEGRTEISPGYFASAASQEQSSESEDEHMTVEGYNE